MVAAIRPKARAWSSVMKLPSRRLCGAPRYRRAPAFHPVSRQAIWRVDAAGARMADVNHRAPEKPAEAGPTEADLRHLADAISQLAWIADGSGAIFWYNRRWYDYTGMTADEMRGRGWVKVHHPDYVRQVLDHYNAAFASGEAWED